jgi:hypothetical protein
VGVVKDLTFNILGRDVSASKALNDVGDAAEKNKNKLDAFGKHPLRPRGGAPAAAPVAGLAIAGGLAAVGAGFIAMGAIALRQNDKVADSWTNLADTVSEGAKQAATPLEGRLASAAGTLQKTFESLEPTLARGFKAADPAVLHLTAGVDEFARRSVPDMVNALEKSEPAFVGLREFMADTGDGVGNFFTQIAVAAPSAGRNVGEFGEITKDALGTAGRLLADLSDNGVGTVHALGNVFHELLGTVQGLSSTGLPVLFGTATGVLGVLDKILQVAGPLAPALGTVIGVMLSAKAGAVVFGAAGNAVAGFGGRLETAAASGGKAAGAVGKLGGALGAIGPWGAVAGGALLAVSAGADAAFGSVDKLTAGLVAGGNAAAESKKQLALNDAAVQAVGKSNGVASVAAKLFITSTSDANAAIAEQRASMSTLERAQVDATAAANNHSRAVELYGSTSDKAQAAAAILAQRQRDLKGAQDAAAESSKTLTQRLLEQQAAALGLAGDNLALRMAADQWEDAQRAVNEAVREFGASSREAGDAMLQQESAALRLVAAAGTEAAAHYANRDSVEAQKASVEAANAKALELAGSMEGPVPQALALFIANMSDSALAAQGATRSVDETNTTVINLSNGKTIKIEADDQATYKINGIQASIDSMRGRTLEIHIQQLVSTTGGPIMADLGNPAKVLTPNKGGLVPGSGPDVDSVPAVLTPGEFVVTRKAVGRALPMLEALNRGAGGDLALDLAASAVAGVGGMSGGAGGGGEFRVTFDWGSGAGLTGADRWLWQWIKETARARGEVLVSS